MRTNLSEKSGNIAQEEESAMWRDYEEQENVSVAADLLELTAQNETMSTRRAALESATERLNAENALKRHASNLLRSHCLDLRKSALRLTCEHSSLKSQQNAMRADIKAEKQVLDAIEEELYKKEQRLKDLKQQLFAATEQLKCKDLEDYEVEEEYQTALCHCEDRQKRQRAVVERCLQRNSATLATALARVESLRQELRAEHRQVTPPKIRKQSYTPCFVSLFFGLLFGILIRILLASQKAVV